MQRIQTAEAPAAIGPYSQALVANGFIFTAGQVAIDPASGKLVEGGIEAETHRVLANLRAVLEAAGSGFEQVVRATIYLTDLADFKLVNTIYAQYLDEHRPARSTVGVAALPVGARVEIDMIAVRPG